MLPASLPFTARMPEGSLSAGQTIAITVNSGAGNDTEMDWAFWVQETPAT